MCVYICACIIKTAAYLVNKSNNNKKTVFSECVCVHIPHKICNDSDVCMFSNIYYHPAKYSTNTTL